MKCYDDFNGVTLWLAIISVELARVESYQQTAEKQI